MSNQKVTLEAKLDRLKFNKQNSSEKAVEASKSADKHLLDEKELTEQILDIEKQIKLRDEKKRVYPDSSYKVGIFLICGGEVKFTEDFKFLDNFVDGLSRVGLTFYTCSAAEKKLKSMEVQVAFDECKEAVKHFGPVVCMDPAFGIRVGGFMEDDEYNG